MPATTSFTVTAPTDLVPELVEAMRWNHDLGEEIPAASVARAWFRREGLGLLTRYREYKATVVAFAGVTKPEWPEE